MLSSFVFLSLFAIAAQAKKACLAWPWYNKPLNPAVFNTPNSLVHSIYDWETYRPPSQNDTAGLEFIGMQRCMDCGSSPIEWLPARLKEQGWTTVYTLNEPDINGISAHDAASWYISHINPLPAKKALPAVTSSTGPGQGLNWVADMIAACAGQCQFDYINVHWYGASMDQFQTFIESAHVQFPNYPLVVTEYALGPPVQPSDMLAFFQKAIPFLESAAYVESHCPYVATSPALAEAQHQDPNWVSSCLYNNDGTPSSVGLLLLNGPYSPPNADTQTSTTSSAPPSTSSTSSTPYASPTTSTPSAAPSAAPTSGTPSAAPTTGTSSAAPSAAPSSGTPSAASTGGTPSGVPTIHTTSSASTSHTASSATASHTTSSASASHITNGKPTSHAPSSKPTSTKSQCVPRPSHRVRKHRSAH